MQDSFNRNIDYLRLSITDSCNYRCIYCMDNDGANKRIQDDILSIEELIDISKAAVLCGIRKIRITGGEPLIRKGVLSLCERIKQINEVEELNITTNGTGLYKMATDLKKAGVDRLNISLDTLNEDRFRNITRIGNLEETLHGIECAIKAGFNKIKINVVLIGGINDDEINDFVELTKENPISVRFIELMPIGPCKKWEKDRFISTNEVLKQVPELLPDGKDGVASIYKIKDYAGSVGLISPISHCFCSECNRLRVTADGRLIPCLHSDIEYSVRGLSIDELKNRFIYAINNKPKEHHIIEKHVSDNNDCMYNIGG